MTTIFCIFLLTILREIVTSECEFYMLKSNIDVCFVTSFPCSLEFLLFHRIEYPKMCMRIFFLFLWLSFCDMTVSSYNKVPSLWPWPLIYEGLFSELGVISKYWPDTRTHRQTDRQTDRVKTKPRNRTDRQTGWKQYLATPSGGEVIMMQKCSCTIHHRTCLIYVYNK